MGVVIEQVQNALVALAYRCDGAIAQDGQGFNGRDASFGRSLAQQVMERGKLSPKQLRAAIKILPLYKGQLEAMGLELPSSVKAIAEIEEIEATIVPKDRIWMKDGIYYITFSYNLELIGRVKQIKGVRWNSSLKSWTIPGDKVEEAIKLFPDFYVEDGVLSSPIAIAPVVAEKKKSQAEEAKFIVKSQETNKNVQRLTEAAGLDSQMPNGWTLRDHQKLSVKWAIAQIETTNLYGVILALDLGLGKTLTALTIAKAYSLVHGAKIVVVCPATLRANWQREAGWVGVSIETYSWAKLPAIPSESFILIGDEAHAIQSGMKTKRGKAFLALTASSNCRATLMLTGTPMKNGRPSNLFPLLKAAKHSLAENKKHYEKYYCNAKATPFCPWDVSGAAHLDELHRNTRDVMLRLTKDDCLDLPPKTRVFREAEVSGEALKTWKENLYEIRLEYQCKRGEPGIDLVCIGKLRKAASLAKIDNAVELAEEVLEEGGQVILFVEFVETAGILHERLGGELLTGQTPVKDRQALVDRFQAGESKVFVSTSGAGGVGITLTAAQTVIMVDRPWTPGDAEQCEGRSHRIGTTGSVTSVWLQWGEADLKVDTLLAEKQERIDMVLQGDRKTMRGVSKSPLEMLKELAEEFFGQPVKKRKEE